MPALLRSAAVVAAAAALTVAAPLAANAATPYPPTMTTGWNGTACSGGTFSFTLPPGTFDAEHALTESVSGTGQSAPAPGTFLAGRTSYSLTSTASGSATIRLTFPSSASGSYNVSVAELGGTQVSYGAITVAAPGSGSCASGAVDPSSTDPVAAAATAHLATTGTYISAGVVWSAVAAVVAGGVLAFFGARRRRTHQG